MANAGRRLTAFLTATGVFAADRYSKLWVQHNLGAFDSKPIIPNFFNLIRSENPGVAFGIFSETHTRYRTALLIITSIAAVAILAYMLWRIDRQDRLTATGLALVFGGALGNVYDRIASGTVTDFLDFYAGSWHWYTFNIADTAICIGAGLLILSSLTSKAVVGEK